MRLLTVGLMATALLVSGCAKDKPKKSHHESKSGHDHSMHSMNGMQGMGDSHAGKEHSMHGMGASHAGHAHAMHHMAAGGKVAVSKGGSKFKPPIKAAQLPDDVWYCEMGSTVHYARGDKGDGKCPLCHMKLKKKVAGK